MMSSEDALIDLSSVDSARALILNLRMEPSLVGPLRKELKATAINSTPQIKRAVKKLLDGYRIKPAQQSRYENVTISVYQLLQELRDLPKASIEQASELDEFVTVLDKSARLSWRRVLLMGGLVLVAGSIPSVFSLNLSVIQQLVSGALLIPSLGLIYTVGLFVQMLLPTVLSKKSWHKKDEEDSIWLRFKHRLFALSSSATNLTAYILILAAAATGPIIATLFVIASFLLVIQELVYLASHPRPKIEQSNQKESLLTLLNANQVHARNELDYDRRKNEIWINLAVAVALTVLVAIWCFVPGGVLLAVPVLATMGIVYLLQHQALQRIEQEAKRQLEEKFKVLEAAYEGAVEAENTFKTGSTYQQVSRLKDNRLVLQEDVQGQQLTEPTVSVALFDEASSPGVSQINYFKQAMKKDPPDESSKHKPEG